MSFLDLEEKWSKNDIFLRDGGESNVSIRYYVKLAKMAVLGPILADFFCQTQSPPQRGKLRCNAAIRARHVSGRMPAPKSARAGH